MSEKFHIQFDGQGPLVIREGAAEKINNPIPYGQSGLTIEGPFNYFDKVGRHYPDVAQKAVVTVSYESRFVDLNLNPHDELAGRVSGNVIENKAVAGLRINSSTKWSADDLVSYLRQNPQILVIPEGENLRSFTRKFSDLKFKLIKEVENSNDDRGNVVDNFVQKVTSKDLPEKLTIKAPLFVGGTEVQFDLEIGLESSQRSLVFYFFSAEYELMKLKEIKELIGGQIAKFNGENICVVEQA